MAKSKEYWAKRFEALEEAQMNKGAAYYAEIEKQYNKASREVQKEVEKWLTRLAENNELTLQGARKLLTADELEEFKWSVMEYIEKGKTLNHSEEWAKALENASAKWHISRLEALKIQMQNHVEVLYDTELDDVAKLMENIYTEGYYHTAFEIQKGFNIGYSLMKLDTNKIEKILSKPWAIDGSNFSDRIWKQKSQLVSELHNNLTQAIIRGQHPHVATEAIAKRFNVSKGQAGRLVMTEAAFFASASNRDCYKDLDVEQYEILATLDKKTSEVCRELDGKVFKMSEYKVGETAPPFHVWCRTTTVPYFDDEFELGTERAARGEDGKTYYVPSDMKYEEWKEAFVEGGSKDDLTLLSDADSESELGAFKKRIIEDEGMEKAYYDTLKDKFSHGSDDAKRVFNKYVPDESVDDYMYEGTAEYKNGKIKMHYGADLNNPRGAGATWYHEHGHMIDELAGNASSNEAFVKALNDDFIDNTLNKSYSEIEAELADMRTQSAVSDIFNGLSKDKINGVATHPLRLDGSSYWTEETIRQEAFAHMFECQFDDLRYVEMKKYFPKALAEFERILKGL